MDEDLKIITKFETSNRASLMDAYEALNLFQKKIGAKEQSYTKFVFFVFDLQHGLV